MWTVLSFVVILLKLVASERCYWNKQCVYDLYSTKTPYETIRGDLRDEADIKDCKPISLWSLHRHGNRNPGSKVVIDIKIISKLKDEIVISFNKGRSHLCAQDIEDLKKWTWNQTIEVSPSQLTEVGYEELFNVAKRIRQRYPHLLEGSANDFYFRTTNEQRTIKSSKAFVNGLTYGTNLNVTVDGPWARDDVIRPYENCQRYQEEVKDNPFITKQLNSYYKSREFHAVRDNVQMRLNISYQLTPHDVYSLYEICRFYRSWSDKTKSPWCAVFSAKDLIVLEYVDDIRHYYRNGYGSWVNVKLGEQAAKDLYVNFEAVINGHGKNIVSYFTHDTMMEMFFCALGLFKDEAPITSAFRDDNRKWRTSFTSAFATNFIAVLNSCNEAGNQTYKVQFFVNENEIQLCRATACSLEDFQMIFQPFNNTDLDFCNLNQYRKVTVQ